MPPDIASEAVRRLLAIQAELNDVLRLIQEQCLEEEFTRYRNEFGKAMATIYLDILDGIFREHPALRPDELKLDE
jgi:hypothetical protein